MMQANIFPGQVMEYTILRICHFSLILNLALSVPLLVPTRA